MRFRDSHLGEWPQIPELIELTRTLAAQKGCLRSTLGVSPDEPDVYALTSSWQDVGSMRRGLGSTAAKMALGPVQHALQDETSVFAPVVDIADGREQNFATDRAADADTFNLPKL